MKFQELLKVTFKKLCLAALLITTFQERATEDDKKVAKVLGAMD